MDEILPSFSAKAQAAQEPRKSIAIIHNQYHQAKKLLYSSIIKLTLKKQEIERRKIGSRENLSEGKETRNVRDLEADNRVILVDNSECVQVQHHKTATGNGSIP